MANNTKNREIIGQLRRACEEMARGFAEMEAAEALTLDMWREAMNALAEVHAVTCNNYLALVSDERPMLTCARGHRMLADDAPIGRLNGPGSFMVALCPICVELDAAGAEYSVQLAKPDGEWMIGVSFVAASDEMAEESARELVRDEGHDWCERIRLLNKGSGREWTIAGVA